MTAQRPHWLAGVVGLELRNPLGSKSPRFAGELPAIWPKRRSRDGSRWSCGVANVQLRQGFRPKSKRARSTKTRSVAAKLRPKAAGSKSGRRIADAMSDRRNPDRIEHAMFEMVGARAAAIACGYEDANDLELAARAGAAASKAMPVILTTELLAGAAGAAAAVWSQAVRWRHRGLASERRKRPPAGAAPAVRAP
jgi:hypothetical protein